MSKNFEPRYPAAPPESHAFNHNTLTSRQEIVAPLGDNETGYFGPGSVTWQLYREPLMLVGGIRALMLQVAHPAVADGVARYSNFKADPFGRGYRTFTAMAMIYFGSKAQSNQTAQRLWKIHSAIRGEAPVPYVATQPELLLWVLATLTDTTLRVFERYPVAGLPPDWKERFYEESKIAARLLGIPDGFYPDHLPAFDAYFKSVVESDLLGSNHSCREVAQAILQHPKAPNKLALLLASGWLPTPICERLGIPKTADAAARMERFLSRFLRIYRLIPSAIRWNPSYHQARYRISKVTGEKPSWAGRFYHWLGSWMKVPLGLEVEKRRAPSTIIPPPSQATIF